MAFITAKEKTNFKEQFIATIKNRVKLLMAFIIGKEKTNFKLAK